MSLHLPASSSGQVLERAQLAAGRVNRHDLGIHHAAAAAAGRSFPNVVRNVGKAPAVVLAVAREDGDSAVGRQVDLGTLTVVFILGEERARAHLLQTIRHALADLRPSGCMPMW